MARHIHLHLRDAKPLTANKVPLRTRHARDKMGRPFYLVTDDTRYVGRIVPDGVSFAGYYPNSGYRCSGHSISDVLKQLQSHHDRRR